MRVLVKHSGQGIMGLSPGICIARGNCLTRIDWRISGSMKNTALLLIGSHPTVQGTLLAMESRAESSVEGG